MAIDRGDDDGSAAVFAWQRLESTVVHQTPCFQVRNDSIIRPDSVRDTVEYVVSPGSVTVLAIDGDDNVLFTRRWLYIHGGSQWRLPSGDIRERETDVTAAQRELLEATGLRCEQLQSLGVVHGADSVCDHEDHLFLATGLSGTRSPGVRKLSFEDAVDLVLSGQVPHAGSACALLTTAVRRAAIGRHGLGRVVGR